MSDARSFWLSMAVVAILTVPAGADVGDPQLRTDHPWYPGELACSTFPRLFATQAELYERVVGSRVTTDEQKALAAWLWRNTHYAHGEEGTEDLWGEGFTRGGDLRSREYWGGFFAHGFGLCGTTHSQWVAEMEALLGHNRGRAVGMAGHNSFEVLLTGGPYRDGKWVLLDHDLSTVVFNRDGTALLSAAEVQRDWKQLTDRRHQPQRQHGWLVSGLHPEDGSSYARYSAAEYLAGYSGPPPIMHLRRGETLRRYLEPGLENGKAFVFWGRNYNTGEIPGLERSHTWVNQPDKMHGSRDGAGYHPGQARYGNAVYAYRPDFSNGDYREGVVAEDDRQVTFEFYTPYVIAATPPNDKPWGVYERGCRNGLVLRGRAGCPVSLSVDQGATWQDCGTLTEALDLTDQAKGNRQYFVRFHAAAKSLARSGLTITTICQANPAIMPRLRDEETKVDFQASGEGVVAAGPTRPQAAAHLVEGKFGTPRVALRLASPRHEPVVAIHAAAHVQSGNPPSPDVQYHIDISLDAGKTWRPMLKDWTITRRGEEPADFWSQSMCWGSKDVTGQNTTADNVLVRFHNTGGKSYARCEAHLVYRAENRDGTRVTFNWSDDAGPHQASHDFTQRIGPDRAAAWRLPTGRNVKTRWVELATMR